LLTNTASHKEHNKHNIQLQYLKMKNGLLILSLMLNFVGSLATVRGSEQKREELSNEIKQFIDERRVLKKEGKGSLLSDLNPDDRDSHGGYDDDHHDDDYYYYPAPSPGKGKSGKGSGKGKSGKGKSGKGGKGGKGKYHFNVPASSPVSSPSPGPGSGGGGGCCDVNVVELDFVMVPPNATVPVSTGLPASTIGTVFIYQDSLFDTDLVPLEGTFVAGLCTRTQLFQNIAPGNDLVGAGYCQFTFTVSDGMSSVTFNAVGELFDVLGGTLAVTGGTGALQGVYGEVEIVPFYQVPTQTDLFTEAAVYVASATLIDPLT